MPCSGVNERGPLFRTIRSSTSVIVPMKPLKSNLVFARNYGDKGWRAHEQTLVGNTRTGRRARIGHASTDGRSRGQGQTPARKQAQRLGRRACMGAPGRV